MRRERPELGQVGSIVPSICRTIPLNAAVHPCALPISLSVPAESQNMSSGQRSGQCGTGSAARAASRSCRLSPLSERASCGAEDMERQVDDDALMARHRSVEVARFDPHDIFRIHARCMRRPIAVAGAGLPAVVAAVGRARMLRAVAAPGRMRESHLPDLCEQRPWSMIRSQMTWIT